MNLKSALIDMPVLIRREYRLGRHRQCMFEVFKFFLCGHRTKLPSAFVPRSCFRQVSLDSLHTYVAYEFGIVGGSERERRIGASGFRRTLEIAPGSGKIADSIIFCPCAIRPATSSF